MAAESSKSFMWDVFVAHSSVDKARVLAIANKLRARGFRVWLDAWEIRPGSNIPARIEEGLENSRKILVCMSGTFFDSEWARLERASFVYDDPSALQERLIPILLSECSPPKTIKILRHIDYRRSRKPRFEEIVSAIGSQHPLSPSPIEKTDAEGSGHHISFLTCVSSTDHVCLQRHTWCRAYEDRLVPIEKYAPQDVKIYSHDNATQILSLENALKKWLAAKEPKNLLLLGEYGIGKTSVCLLLFRMLALQESDAIHPIYISLGELAFELDRERDVFAALDKVLESSEARRIRNTPEKYIFLLDGFDEMFTSASLAEIRRRLTSLRPLTERARTILTCRTSIFHSSSDLELAFSKSGIAGEAFQDINRDGQFSVMELQHLSQAAVLGIIETACPAEEPSTIWREIEGYYDLKDLTRRPMLLRVVLQSLPTLRRNAGSSIKFTTADLYSAYVTQWAVREIDTHPRSATSPEEKLRLADSVAESMYRIGNSSLKKSDVGMNIRKVFSGDIFSSEDLRRLELDCRGGSFLTCDNDGIFRFMHRSFYEFFVARAFFQQLGARGSGYSGNNERDIWSIRWLSREIAEFLAGMFRPNQRFVTELISVTHASTEPVKLWNELHILSLLGPEALSPDSREAVRSVIFKRTGETTDAVLVRQYARVAARHISSEEAQQLIGLALEIIASSDEQRIENIRTYTNYYGGANQACLAMIDHLKRGPAYDSRMHIHILGQLGNREHASILAQVSKSLGVDLRDEVSRSISKIHSR